MSQDTVRLKLSGKGLLTPVHCVVANIVPSTDLHK
jgi:hypothetical protein